MYLKLNDGYADGDLGLLTKHLECLDGVLAGVNGKISASRDPASEGLFGTGEYFIGAGFAAIQRYILATYPYLQATKWDALAIPPDAGGGVSVVQAINAGANYWKHLDEWGLRNIVDRDINSLSCIARQTIETIECLTPWADYTCSNLLAKLNGMSRVSLNLLLPLVTEWGDNLDERFGTDGRRSNKPNQPYL
jgi:hypothetical protein